MKFALASLCLPALLAAAPSAPLITGAVRDQLGNPIAGATVRAGSASATTDAAGTFALASAARSVWIGCDYCERSQAIVAPDGTVAAIVRRYSALAGSPLDSNELNKLPYAHVDSKLGLMPFVVVNQSTGVVPGPRVSYYGIDSLGGLIVDDGVPVYDVAAGASSLRTLPAFDPISAQARDQSDAFRYADAASGGTFLLQTTPGGTAGSAVNGTTRAFSLAHAAETGAFNVSASEDQLQSRERADGSLTFPLGSDALAVNAFASQNDETDDGTISASMTAVRLHYQHDRASHVYADALADDAGYATFAPAFSAVGRWSDFALQAGVESQTRLDVFADVGTRFATGFYTPAGESAAPVAGVARQSRLDFGVRSQEGPFSWRAGAGAFDVAYSGGSSNGSIPLHAQILSPALSASYDFGPQWNLALDESQSFRLPTLVEAYGYHADDSALYYDRYGVRDATLTYNDRHRLRISLVSVGGRASLMDSGTIAAAGASFSWQAAPLVSVRAWTLHIDDATRPYAPVFRFGVPAQPVTPASLWTTYENPAGFRADVLWRRDVVDAKPQTHVDGALGAPIGNGLRWFVGSERYLGRRSIVAGLQR